MRIYPAIDIKDGKCVRLVQGKFDDVSVYGDDPVKMALKWQSLGAEYIHVVDLDGARSGRGVSGEAIAAICAAVDVPVQTGGGVRSMDDIHERLSWGVSRVILGTAAITNPEFVARASQKYAEKIAVGIDAIGGYAVAHGWEQVSGKRATELAQEVTALGVKTIIYTDISTDGTLAGPNIAAMRQMAELVDADVIASGGVSCIDDIYALKSTGVEGVIVGKALYTNKIDLKEAIAAAKR